MTIINFGIRHHIFLHSEKAFLAFPPSPSARHYHPTLSIWLSVDPMSDKYPSTSPYTYCANNPVRLVDEDGREIGDYFDLNGKYLGTDGIDDGKKYVVTDARAISYRRESDSRSNAMFCYVSQNDKNDIHQVPNNAHREEIISRAQEFDKANPDCEWGGLCGFIYNSNIQDFDCGDEFLVWGQPCQPRTDKATYHQLTTKEASEKLGNAFIAVFFDYHFHPKPTSRYNWQQQPSDVDIKNAGKRQDYYERSFAVFGLGDKKVYFYNDKGMRGSMSFETFKNLGK
ncbi:MAG: hypothetical protein PUF10_06395 [Bacteroidales bacterium]|nr:hypothetical protein [Bacteroidales bacterium]